MNLAGATSDLHAAAGRAGTGGPPLWARSHEAIAQLIGAARLSCRFTNAIRLAAPDVFGVPPVWRVVTSLEDSTTPTGLTLRQGTITPKYV